MKGNSCESGTGVGNSFIIMPVNTRYYTSRFVFSEDVFGVKGNV